MQAAAANASVGNFMAVSCAARHCASLFHCAAASPRKILVRRCRSAHGLISFHLAVGSSIRPISRSSVLVTLEGRAVHGRQLSLLNCHGTRCSDASLPAGVTRASGGTVMENFIIPLAAAAFLVGVAPSGLTRPAFAQGALAQAASTQMASPTGTVADPVRAKPPLTLTEPQRRRVVDALSKEDTLD